MDTLGQSLHEKMRKLCIKCQNGTLLRQKAKWALFEEKLFNRLIEDIIDLVNALLEALPAVNQQQLHLCEIEVSEIGVEILSALKDIVQAQDKCERSVGTVFQLPNPDAIYSQDKGK
jgi:Lon protease-like protein